MISRCSLNGSWHSPSFELQVENKDVARAVDMKHPNLVGIRRVSELRSDELRDRKRGKV